MNNIGSPTTSESTEQLGINQGGMTKAGVSKTRLLDSMFNISEKESIFNLGKFRRSSGNGAAWSVALHKHGISEAHPDYWKFRCGTHPDCRKLSVEPMKKQFCYSRVDLAWHLTEISEEDIVKFDRLINNAGNNRITHSDDNMYEGSVDVSRDQALREFCTINYNKFDNYKELGALVQLKICIDKVIEERDTYLSKTFFCHIGHSLPDDGNLDECASEHEWSSHPMYTVVHSSSSDDILKNYDRKKHIIFSLPEPPYLQYGDEGDPIKRHSPSDAVFYNLDPLCFLGNAYNEVAACCPHSYIHGGMCEYLFSSMLGKTIDSSIEVLLPLIKLSDYLVGSRKNISAKIYHLISAHISYIRYLFIFLHENVKEFVESRNSLSSLVVTRNYIYESGYGGKMHRIDRKDRKNIESLEIISCVRRFINAVSLLEKNIIPVIDLLNFVNLKEESIVSGVTLAKSVNTDSNMMEATQFHDVVEEIGTLFTEPTPEQT
ncbi:MULTISPECIES: hypothetical protein [Candidatus Ichthyocystis]|uniref:Uncharacterized protein n=1 Tax=Candidatus Ichthyocystis hellenicum TaxID=1561003 RepID=A0A0S4M4Z8_9BURK|nr:MULTISPECIES: hypothetical protein [Ichthyocystis]CUT18143.1 hypothetical protein Ark11_1339 [Candidatus Ichthyocystis hellenicum]